MVNLCKYTVEIVVNTLSFFLITVKLGRICLESIIVIIWSHKVLIAYTLYW